MKQEKIMKDACSQNIVPENEGIEEGIEKGVEQGIEQGTEITQKNCFII